MTGAVRVPLETVGAADRLKEQVARASRILALEGYCDLTLGHVSARAEGGRIVYIKRKGPALNEVYPDDVLPVDLDDPDACSAPGLHLETVMHLEVYRARPDVGAVIHGHPPFATALGATEARLEFLTHDAALFADGLPAYDETPGLIVDVDEGRRVAHALGRSRAVLLRNHGVLVAGADIRWAVLTAVTLERAIRLQVLCATLGPLRPISQEWADRLLPVKYQEKFLDEYWSEWVRRLERDTARPEWDGTPSRSS